VPTLIQYSILVSDFVLHSEQRNVFLLNV
jgi:hypothetical protein